jgi:DNA-binding transcriptional regulator YiaG
MATNLERYDATALIGLSVVLINGAKQIIEAAGEGKTETYVEIPNMDELSAAAAMVRCLMPQKLRGAEIRAIRKILGMTAREFSEAMGEKTAIETISRWENEAEFAGGYAEKLIRIAVCERLKSRAPGVDYDPEKLIRTKMIGNGKMDPKSIPTIQLRRMLVRLDSRTNDSWTDDPRAAA